MTNSLNIAAMYTLQMMRFYLWLKTVELQSGFAVKVALPFIPTIYHYKNIYDLMLFMDENITCILKLIISFVLFKYIS